MPSLHLAVVSLQPAAQLCSHANPEGKVCGSCKERHADTPYLQGARTGGGGGGGGGGGRVNGFVKADLSTRVNSRSVEVRGYTLSGRGACQLHGTAVLTDSGPRGNERPLSRIRRGSRLSLHHVRVLSHRLSHLAALAVSDFMSVRPACLSVSSVSQTGRFVRVWYSFCSVCVCVCVCVCERERERERENVCV